MPIINISEIENKEIPKQKPVKEVMSKYIPNISEDLNIPCRNGFIWVLTGSGGSGKTSLMLNFFKSKVLYRNKFNNIFYFTPESSFLSVEKHVFCNHDKIYHILDGKSLLSVYDQLEEIKKGNVDEEPEYTCVIIDDFADKLKRKDISDALYEFIVKTRHLNCCIIITLQSYLFLAKQCRKLITNMTIFKPKSFAEWLSICIEMFDMSKDDSLKLYHYVFNEPYAHIDVDFSDNSYYKNWNKLVIKNTDDII
jgi:hypothetical protein